MAVENRFTGKDLYVKFNTTVLSGAHTNFQWSTTGDQADLTAGADTFHYFVGMREATTMSMDSWMNGSTLTPWNAVAINTVGSLEVGPYGTATGKPKYSWSRTLVSGVDPAVPYDGGITYAIKWNASAIGTATYY